MTIRGMKVKGKKKAKKRPRLPALRCEQPDRHSPGLKCGYPLPCPYHTVVLDLTTEPASLNIPVTAKAGLNERERLVMIGRALSEEEDR